MSSNRSLQVLILEDQPSDAELVLDELRQAGFKPEWRRVDTRADYLAHLSEDLDLILADYSLPQFNALEALHGLQQSGLDIPFIVVTGTISEEVAVECMKQGAADYLLKDRLTRLGPAVVKALEDKGLHVEKRQMTAALHASEERHRLLFENAGMGIGDFTPEGRAMAFNKLAAAYMEGNPDDFVGKTIIELYGAEAGAVYLERIREAACSTASHVYEDFVSLPTGDRWFHSTYSRIADSSGHVVGVQIISDDITERKHAEEALRASEERLRHVLENMPVMLHALDENLNIIVWNRECERVMGYTADEIINHPSVSELLYPDPAYREQMQTQLIASDNYRGWEWQPTCKDGSVRTIAWFDVSGQYPVPGWFRWGIGVDITEQKQAEQEIRRLNAELEQRVQDRTSELNHAKERIETILNSSSDIIILCRPDGSIDQVNPAFDEVFQYDPDEVYRLPLTRLVSPEYVTELERAFVAVVENRQPQRLEMIARSNRTKAIEVDVVLSPIVQHGTQLAGVICSLRDIAERKQMEARLRQMLEHEIELGELKSRYVSMAAHDLRNPLAVIQSTISMIHQYRDRLTSEKIEEKYRNIQASIDVMVEMLDDILTLGKVESGRLSFKPAGLDVITFCENIVAEMKQATGSSQAIHFSSQGNCRIALLDAKLLRHILNNLLSNALKYSPADRLATFMVLCEAEQITFRIQDQGMGIPKADQARLFEPFHRATNARHVPGTGLGLAIVKQSVELHGGTIAFESEEGRGTTFTVVIPDGSSGETQEECFGR